MSALPLLVAMLLALLQAGMPLAHASLHWHGLITGKPQVQQLSERLDGDSPVWRVVAADERPCALCTMDDAPALPGARGAAEQITTRPAELQVLSARVRSSAPLDVFCRPPPAA